MKLVVYVYVDIYIYTNTGSGHGLDQGSVTKVVPYAKLVHP